MLFRSVYIPPELAVNFLKSPRCFVQLIGSSGGADFKIISFYAMPPVIHRGDDVDMCYGVSNAKSVKLDPPDVPSMFPSLDRCVKVAPKKTTTYTFTADDGKGNTQTQKLTIEVR